MNLLHRNHRRNALRSRKRIIISFCVVFAVLYVLYLGVYASIAYASVVSLQRSVARLELYASDRDITNLSKEIETTRSGIGSLQGALRHLSVAAYVPYIGTQYTAARDILSVSGILANDAQKGVLIAQEVFQVLDPHQQMDTFKDISAEQKGRVLTILQKNKATLKMIAADVRLQSQILDRFDTTALHPELADAVTRIKGPVNGAAELLSVVLPFLDQGPAIIGFPGEKTYLFLLQNNSEVRGTGGFIGNYGILKLHNGEISAFHTDNIYNIDDPAARYLHVPPPAPFRKFFNADKWWFLRDSNWSPDFSESAQKAIWFYQQEGGKEQVDGVITITQDFIIPLLRFTGPIEVEGIVFTADNFEEELQYQVEKGFYKKGIPESQRKEIIGELSDKILQRLYQLPTPRLSEVFSTIQRLVQERHLMMYFKDPSLQSYARSQNWTGEFRKTDGDFLMVVDSNMGALKTDQAMDKYINYSVRQESDGTVYANVDLTYVNNGTFSWLTTRYKDWVRIYAPAGSTLVASEGAVEDEESDSPGRVEVGTELDKTYFGAYIVVDPKTSKHFSVEYKLPSRIADQIRNGRYQLTAQKQSGVSNQQFQGTLSFSRPVASYDPVGFFNTKTDARSVQFQSDLRVDRFFSVMF